MTNTEVANASKIILGSTEALSMYVGSQLVWLAHTGRLPIGYTEVEYISSTSTGGQYINLDIMLYDTLNKNYDIAFKFNFKGRGQDNHNQPTIFGCQKNVSPWPGTFIRVNNNENSVKGRYIGANVKDAVIGNKNAIIELPVQTPPNKNVYSYNNSNQTHTWGTSLFCIFDPDLTPQRFTEADVYYFKLFVGGELVRDMVPCIDPNNVVGLYDLVNNIFYSSPNGAAFVAGPVV